MIRQFRVLSLFLVVSLLLGLSLPVRAAARPQSEAALEWLRTARIADAPIHNPDGGFSNGFAPASDLGTTVGVMLAGVAAGVDVNTWRTAEGHTALDFVAAQVSSGVVTDTARLSRAVFAAVASGADPRAFAGHDLIAELLAQQAANGQFGDSLYAHAYALLALSAAGETLPTSAMELLLTQQQPGGGWAMFGGNEPDSADTNTTALAMQALVAAGKRDAAFRALDYLRTVQNEDGGFPWQKPSPWGTATDANSTAVVMQALIAVGEDPATWKPAGASPSDALLALYHEASGGFLWQAVDTASGMTAEPNVLATAQAVQALEGMSLLVVRERAAALLTATSEVPTPTATPEPVLPTAGGYAAPELFLLAGVGLMALGGWTLRRRG